MRVNSAEDVHKLVEEGEQRKIIAETKANKSSSRSHSIFKIGILMEEFQPQTGRKVIRTSQINLVDLAGSEGASKTRGQAVLRQREGGNINKSLLALSNVIQKLS